MNADPETVLPRVGDHPPPSGGITLDQLRCFLAAARIGHFTHAAESCHLSQSAFSRQIQGLERALGAHVFDRVGRRVTLNDAGRELESRAAEIVARVDRLVDDLAPAGRGLRGTIRLGANMTVGIRLLPNWLAAFGWRYNGIHVSLLLRNTSEMVQLLRGESIDAAIQEEPEHRELTTEPALKVHLRYRDELWVLGPKGIDPKARPPENVRWFGLSDISRRVKMARLGFAVGDTTRVPGAEVALKFVEAGMGYTVIPGFMARASAKAGRVTRLHWTLSRSIGFVTLDQRPPSPCVQRLIDFLRPHWEAEAARQARESDGAAAET